MIRRSRLSVAAAAAAAVAVAPTALAHPTDSTGASVTVTAGKPSEFGFTLSAKSVPHGSVVFKVTNGSGSGLAHDFKLCSTPARSTSPTSLPNSCAGKATAQLGKGQSASLSVAIPKPGNYEYLCTVPGHAAGGMKGILKVT
jgi:nitrite reductase (NO-forming)